MPEAIDIKDLELNALLEITQAINNNLPENDLYRIYKFTLLGDLKVRRVALFVKDEHWSCKVAFGTMHKWEGQSLADEFHAIHKTQEVVSENQLYDEFDQVIPVLHKDKLLAVVFLGGERHLEGEGSSTFLQALTNIVLVAIENKKLAKQQLEQEAYRKELEIAKKVQNFLFPKSLPKSNQLKIEAIYLPHHDVGGDYYDYLVIDKEKFLLCVADVSGKGVPAALLMSNFQASLRTLVRKTNDLKEIVNELNHVICTSGNGEHFITFFIGIYDFGTHTLEYANCGHNPQYLIHDGQLTELNIGTTVLGMFDPLPFLDTASIESLDEFAFFGYTDGLTETFNTKDEPYGEERLKTFLLQSDLSDIQKFNENLLRQLDDFRQDRPYGDDITLLTCLVNNK